MTQDSAVQRGISYVVLSIVLSAGAQLLMKVGMHELGGLANSVNSPASWLNSPELIPVALWVVSGLALYALSMVSWLLALTKYELSMAYPLLSLSYVLVYLVAIFWPRLHEPASLNKTLGILLILAGTYLVTRPTGKPRRLPHD